MLERYTDITTDEEQRLNAHVKETRPRRGRRSASKILELAEGGDIKGAQKLLMDNTKISETYLAAVDDEFELNVHNGKIYGEHITERDRDDEPRARGSARCWRPRSRSGSR